MSAHGTELSRRGFLGGSLLFVAGAAAACSTSPTGGAGAKTTLNVWFHAYGEAGTQQAATRYASAFTKANPDIAVKVTWIPGDYASKLSATLLTDGAPDVFEIGDFDEFLARRGQIAALDDLYGSAKSDFEQGDLDQATVDGKLYGVKTLDDVMMLYYRKGALAKAGITPPTTFDALASAAKALTTKDTKGLFLGNDGVGDSPLLAVWANGGELVADGKVSYASPQAVEAVSALKRLHDDQSLLLGFTTDWWDPSAFVQNVVPMQWGGLWSMPAIKTALGDDFGVLPWPALKPGGTPPCGSAAGPAASTPRASTWTRRRSSSSGSGSNRPTCRRTGRRATASTSRRASPSPRPPTSCPRARPRRPWTSPPSSAAATPGSGTPP